MHHPDDEDALVERAAAPIRADISKLESEIPVLLRPVLAGIRDRALEQGYTLKTLRQELRVQGAQMVELTRHVGLTPWNLVVEIRMSTAAELLRATDLDVDTIAWLVGYAETGSLRQKFREWCGLRPSDFRGWIKRAEKLAGPPPPGAFSLFYWRRVREGRASPEEAEALLGYFERLYATPGGGDQVFLTGFAAEVSGSLDELAWLDQREAVRYVIELTSPHLFDELSARSLAASRRGASDRAAQLAELALHGLEAMEDASGTPEPEGTALAWAWLAGAHARAGDGAAAAQAWARCEQAWAELSEDARARLGFEQGLAQAELRASQGRHAEALELAGAAVERASSSTRRERLGRALLLRATLGFRVRRGEAWADQVAADLARARRLLAGSEHAAEQAELLDLGARMGARREAVDEVASAARRLRKLASELDKEDSKAARRARCAARCWRGWVDSRRGDPARAERCWRRAREGLVEPGETVRAAWITVELVMLELERGRRQEALALGRELLAELAQCHVPYEGLAALSALSRAVESGQVEAEMLAEVRRGLERLA